MRSSCDTLQEPDALLMNAAGALTKRRVYERKHKGSRGVWNAAERDGSFKHENAYEEWSTAGIGNAFLMRYYEGSIDQTILEKGRNYNSLGDVVILFITPFDPFDARGYYKYTFRNTCREDKNLVLDDGVTKVVLNAAGNKGDIAPELREFLQLVAGNADTVRYAEDSFADRVQRQVHIARRNAKWRKEYMEWEMTLRNEREKGREEGREEERAKTEEQRKRADAEKERADAAEERIRILEEQLALLQRGG